MKIGCGSLGTFLFILFLGLKLAEVGQVAHWSWWWVFAPIWIPVAGMLGFLLFMLILAVIFEH